MKKLMSLFLAITLVVSLITAVPVFAAVQTGTVEGTSITWSYDEDTKVFTLSGTGEIPNSKLTDKGVTSTVAAAATKVVVGEGITELGYNSLYDFTKVTVIEFPSTLAKIQAGVFINWNAFSGTFTIPKTVTYLGGYPWQNNSKIKSVVFEGDRSSELKLIKETFKSMSGLTSVYLPDNVIIDTTDETISSSTGAYTKRVTSVADLFGGTSVPANVTIWTENSNVAETIKGFEDYATSGLKVYTLPVGTTAYGTVANLEDGYWIYDNGTLNIYGRGEYTAQHYNCGYAWKDAVVGTDITKVVFNEGITAIPAYFCGNADYTSNGVTYKKMVNIAEIKLPSSLETIGNGAFINCSNLKTVSGGFPEGLETIGKQAFQNCPLGPIKNNALIIPASVKSIGENAFVNGNSTSVNAIIFAKGSKLETIGASAFNGKWSVTTVEIPATVTSIGENAFNTVAGSALTVYFEGAKPDTIGANAFARTGTGASVKVYCYQDGFAASDFGSLAYLTVQKLSPVLASGLTLTVGDTDVTASATFRAPAAMAANQEYILIIAAYDSNDALVDVNIDTTGVIEADTTNFETGKITKTIAKVSGATKYKAFLWDSLAGCAPITEAK